MTKDYNASVKRTRIAVVLTCIILVLGICVFALVTYLGSMGVASEEDIRAAIDAGESDGTTVTAHLKDLGIRGFTAQKLKLIEQYFDAYYYKELADVRELAESTALLFLEYFYDEIDLKNKTAVTDAICSCYVAAVGDPYAYYFTEREYEAFMSDMSGDENSVGIGVYVELDYVGNTVKVTSVFPDSAAEAAGILQGDYIIGIDGSMAEDIGVNEMMDLVSGEIGTEVRITVKRGDETLELVATRSELSDITVSYELDESKIGYIRVLQFKENTPEQFYKAVDHMTENGAVGIVFDMRSNPGGLLDAVIAMIDYIVPDGNRIASYQIGTDSKTVFTANDGHSVDLPIAVLCNGNTASAGELFTAAMRDYGKSGILKTEIVGETTYKKGIMQSTFTLFDGSAVKLTVAFYNPPSDVNYDGEGVVPTVPVTNDGQADDQLAAAKAEIIKMIESASVPM